jgi:hypothetical protein
MRHWMAKHPQILQGIRFLAHFALIWRHYIGAEGFLKRGGLLDTIAIDL